jgi:hypothetical protein
VKYSISSKLSYRTNASIVLSFVYAKLVLVACIALLLAEVATFNIPLFFFEVRKMKILKLWSSSYFIPERNREIDIEFLMSRAAAAS